MQHDRLERADLAGDNADRLLASRLPRFGGCGGVGALRPPGNPPMLLMHGDADRFISPAQSKTLYGALTHPGVDATLHVVIGIDHTSTFWRPPRHSRKWRVSLSGVAGRGRAVQH